MYKIFSKAIILFLILLFCLFGCGGGGGGGGSDFKTATSASFSPMSATDSEGNTTKLKWVYTVNNGEPVDTYTEDLFMSVDFNDITLIVDPSNKKSTAEMSGKISGDVTGSYKADISDDFSFIDGSTYISKSEMTTTMNISADGESGSIVMDLLSTFSPAAEWFLDRDDMDQLDIGYTHDSDGVDAYVTGTLQITDYGTEPIDYYGHITDTWVITDKKESITVQGKTYDNIVEVTRYTKVPDAYGTGNDDATIIYWVAKGVGWVKASGHFRVLDEPLDVELVDTNLVVRSDGSDSNDNGSSDDNDGSSSDIETVTSASFSPMSATDSEGNATKLNWVYTVNNGEPLDTYTDGFFMSLDFDDITLIVDPSNNKSTAEMSGKISGDATGSYAATIDDDFFFVGGATYISSSNINMTMNISAEGESGSIVMDLLSTFSPAAEWFLDRDDLDQLDIGYTHDSDGVDAYVTGTLQITDYGTEPIDYYGYITDTWVITDKQESITVQGKTYDNIVEVTRYTKVPDAYGTGNDDATIIYWVAKGIGWVKASGHFRFQDEPLDIELVDTNLVVAD